MLKECFSPCVGTRSDVWCLKSYRTNPRSVFLEYDLIRKNTTLISIMLCTLFSTLLLNNLINVFFPLNANGNIFTRCLYMYFKHVYNKKYVDVIVGVYWLIDVLRTMNLMFEKNSALFLIVATMNFIKFAKYTQETCPLFKILSECFETFRFDDVDMNNNN